MSSKEIKIRWLSDDSAIDQSIQRLQQKLKQMNQSSAGIQNIQNNGGTLSKRAEYAQKVFQKSSAELLQRESRELEQKQRKESLGLLKKQRELRKIEKAEGNITAEKQKQIDLLKEEINLRSQKIVDIESTKRNIDRSLRDITGETGQGVGGGSGPSMNLGRMSNYKGLRKMGFGARTSRLLSSFGGPSSVVGGLAAMTGYGIQLGTSAYDEYAEKERNILTAQGSAFQSGSRGLKEQMSGRGIEGAIFNPERQEGLRMSRDEMSSRRTRDILNSISGAISTGLKGALAGSLVGGVAGGVIGGIGGLGTGIAGTLLDKNKRQAIFGTKEYYSNITAEGLKKASANEDRLRLLNWQKNTAYQDLQQNMGIYNRATRMFGEGNPLADGSMLRSMADIGISRRTGLPIAGQLMQTSGLSGGSAEEVRQSYMLQQGGLTNAPRLMGAIRGISKGFGEQATDESIKKLFTAAVSAGLDDSKKIEQLRQFSNISAEMAMKSGTRVEEVASEVAKATIGEGSVNMRASQSALAAREQMSNSRGGAALQRKLAYASSKEGRKNLGNISGDIYDIAQISTLKMSEISEDNPVVQDLMKKMGVNDIEEFKRRKTKMDLVGGIARGSTRKMFDKLTKGIKDLTPEEATKSMMSGGKNADLFAKLSGRLNVESPEYAGIGTYRGKMALVSSLARGQGKGNFGKLSSEEIDKLRSGEGGMLIRPDLQSVTGKGMYQDILGRGENAKTTQFEKARASDEAQVMDRLSKHIDAFAEQAKNWDKNAAQMSAAMNVLKEVIKSGADDMEEVFNKVKQSINTESHDSFRFFNQKPEPSANNGE